MGRLTPLGLLSAIIVNPYPITAVSVKSTDVSSVYLAECWNNSELSLCLSILVVNKYFQNLGWVVTLSLLLISVRSTPQWRKKEIQGGWGWGGGGDQIQHPFNLKIRGGGDGEKRMEGLEVFLQSFTIILHWQILSFPSSKTTIRFNNFYFFCNMSRQSLFQFYYPHQKFTFLVEKLICETVCY